MLISFKDIIYNMKFESKKELDSKKNYTLYPADEYKLRVIEIKEDTQKKYQSEELEEIVNIKLEIVSFRDGASARDNKGQDLKGLTIYFTARPSSVGFTKAGIPSKTRQLVAYTLGMGDITDEINFEAWEQLLGKEVDAKIIVKQNTKGQDVNRIEMFFPKRRRGYQVDLKDEDIPVIDDINAEAQIESDKIRRENDNLSS
jgi:hypothetical protein